MEKKTSHGPKQNGPKKNSANPGVLLKAGVSLTSTRISGRLTLSKNAGPPVKTDLALNLLQLTSIPAIQVATAKMLANALITKVMKKSSS